jgi:hypothetical protein
MQPADFRDLDHVSLLRRVHGTSLRRVPVQRQLRSGFVIVVHEAPDNLPQMLFPEHDHMVETFPAQGSDDPLDIQSLPGTSGSDDHLLDAEGLHSFTERRAVHGISVADQEAGQFTVAKRFHQLL